MADFPAMDPNERSPLLGCGPLATYHSTSSSSETEVESQYFDDYYELREKRHLLASLLAPIPRIGHYTFDLQHWEPLEAIWKTSGELVTTLPAVAIALLLNLLDALSYGILLFPTGESIFAASGPEGMSLFYISCIIAQLVYSSGSAFQCSVGSQLIEAVPFFHRMCAIIIQQMGTENPEAVRATAVTAYAMSAIFTGLTFMTLGMARLGRLVDLIPRTVLIGCIGGIGIFLLYTGIAVSARMDGALSFSMGTLHHLFEKGVIFLWTIPLLLAVLLLTIQRFFDRSWLLPLCFAIITAMFYVSAKTIGNFSAPDLRELGWLFEPPATGLPFYNLYAYYKFHLVNWQAVWATIPTQLALTFFSILHVPINVPNLATQMEKDNVDIDRELFLHGISNTLSGCCGSIQNYLCFVNSVYFIRTGAESRLAGYLLAVATLLLWVINSDIVGFVPIMIVATLIYMLGIELSISALVSTFYRMHFQEYCVIVATALAMAFYDFVSGIGMGLGLAGLTYIVSSSRVEAIRDEISGADARSTTLRHPHHRKYLDEAGPQVRVIKLGGFLSFGTINVVESRVRSVLEDEQHVANQLGQMILDFDQVTGIDFSAAEAFGRIKRSLQRQHVRMLFTGLAPASDMYSALQKTGLFEILGDDSDRPSTIVHRRLEDALEEYEHHSILSLESEELLRPTRTDLIHVDAEDTRRIKICPIRSARNDTVHSGALQRWTHQVLGTCQHDNNVNQPLRILLRAVQGLSEENADFWSMALPYFSPRIFPSGESRRGGLSIDVFCLLSSGYLHVVHHNEQGDFLERIAPGTACGQLPLFSDNTKPCTVVAKSDCIAWAMTRPQWNALRMAERDVANELVKVGIKLSAERSYAVAKYAALHAT